MACSLADKLSKLFDMANHLFFWAGLSCAQWEANGARAFFCELFKLCQYEEAVELGVSGETDEVWMAFGCVICADAHVTVVLKTTATKPALKLDLINLAP